MKKLNFFLIAISLMLIISGVSVSAAIAKSDFTTLYNEIQSVSVSVGSSSSTTVITVDNANTFMTNLQTLANQIKEVETTYKGKTIKVKGVGPDAILGNADDVITKLDASDLNNVQNTVYENCVYGPADAGATYVTKCYGSNDRHQKAIKRAVDNLNSATITVDQSANTVTITTAKGVNDLENDLNSADFDSIETDYNTVFGVNIPDAISGTARTKNVVYTDTGSNSVTISTSIDPSSSATIKSGNTYSISDGTYTGTYSIEGLASKSYTITVSTSTSSSSGGGSSAFATTIPPTQQEQQPVQPVEPAVVDTTPIVIESGQEEIVSATPGSSKRVILKVGGKAKIALFNEKGDVVEHTAEVVDVGEDYVVLVIRSNPITVLLKLLERREVDIDGDGVADIAIKLNTISNGAPDLTFETLKSPATTGTIAGITGQAIKEQGKAISKWWAVIAAIIILIAALIYLGSGSKRSKSSKAKKQ